MHTYEFGQVVFNVNGDFSGDVRVCNLGSKEEVWVPFGCIKAFVAQYVRETKISQLESVSDDELLGTGNGRLSDE